jgi:hypothetical protein
MSKTIDVSLTQVRFPSTCVVCMSPASKAYELHRIFSMGRRSYTVAVSVPMCDVHFQAASFKGTAEKLVGTVGVVGGILSGLFATTILLLRWKGTGEGNLILNLFVGGVLGLGIFLIVWAGIALWVAPLFAEPESQEARNAVRITRYWANEQIVRLEFQNEQLAEIVGRQNS